MTSQWARQYLGSAHVDVREELTEFARQHTASRFSCLQDPLVLQSVTTFINNAFPQWYIESFVNLQWL